MTTIKPKRSGSGAISAQRRREIVGILRRIEREEHARILLAVESGSRAWGFASPDSDYDVRFIYVRRLDWYLALDARRDVIELPISGELDVNGWDLQKALRLLLKPNPVLLEWLQSPIVYCSARGFARRMLRLAQDADHRHACAYHYARLGQRQFAIYIDGRDQVALKKYFYALRPALALTWLRNNPTGIVPMDMARLLAGVRLSRDVRRAVDRLMEAKSRTRELGVGARLPELDAFILAAFAESRDSTRPPPAGAELIARANALFRDQVMR
jgi:uncharacterized protein